MFHFRLYNDEKLKGFKHFEKVAIVNRAIKLSRQEHPVNLVLRLILISTFCLLPGSLLYYFYGISLAIPWSVFSILILNIKLASNEIEVLKPYVVQSIDS